MTSKQIKQKLQEVGLDPTKVLISNKYEILEDANRGRQLGLRTQMIHRDLWFYDKVTSTLHMVPSIWDKREQYPYERKGRSDNKKYWIESKQWVTLEEYIGVPEPVVTVGPVEEDGTREINGPRVNGKQKVNYNGYNEVLDIEEKQKQIPTGTGHKVVQGEETDELFIRGPKQLIEQIAGVFEYVVPSDNCVTETGEQNHWLFDFANDSPIPEDNLPTEELQDELISNATLRDLYAILYHVPVSYKDWVNKMVKENGIR
jgi:hypothetical protein